MKKQTKMILIGIVGVLLVVTFIFLKNHIVVTSNGISISIGGSDGPTTVFIAGKLPKGEKNMTYTSITMEEAKDIFQNSGDYIILDVRRADDFSEGHIPGAVNYANEDILQDKPEVLPDLEQTIYVYCRSGRRSKEAADKLVQMGYTNIIEIGGILDWNGELEK